MNPGLNDYYRPFGQPATASVTVKKMPTAGTTVTVNGTAYTYGSDGWEGRTTQEVAQYLAAAVNADRNRQDRHAKTNPISAVWAMHYGVVVRFVASEPGLAGNSLTLATSEATEFTVSGATFSGGAAGASIPVSSTTAVETKNFAELSHATEATVTAKPLSATPLLVRRALVYGLAANTQNVTIGPNSNATAREVTPGGGEYLIEAHPGTVVDLNTWYSKPATAAVQNLSILYQAA